MLRHDPHAENKNADIPGKCFYLEALAGDVGFLRVGTHRRIYINDRD